MSAIRQELMAAAGMAGPKRGESETDFLIRLQKAVSVDISEDAWDALSADAQDWNNAATDALLAKKELPAFKDAAVAEEPAATGRRRGSAKAAEPEVYEPKVGDSVIVTTKRGKTAAGIIVDLDDVTVVLNKDGEDGAKDDDLEFPLAGLTFELAGATAPDGGGDDAAGDPEVGDTVEAVTSRDKKIVGKVIEIDDENLVLEDAAGTEHELVKAKLKSVIVKVTAKPAPKAAAEPEAAAAGRRGRGAATTAAAEPEAGDKPKRSSNAGKDVSQGDRIRQIICDDPDITPEAVGKQLKKEGYEFRDTSVTMIHKDTVKLFSMLRERKLMK